MQHDAVFHQGLHCLLRLKQIFGYLNEYTIIQKILVLRPKVQN